MASSPSRARNRSFVVRVAPSTWSASPPSSESRYPCSKLWCEVIPCWECPCTPGSRQPSSSTNLKLGRHPLIDRQDRDSAVSVIAELGQRVSRGEVSAVIFPEGSRSGDGKLKPFKPAGLGMLLRSAPQAKVVPCCLDNSWQLMKNSFLPIPRGVKLHFSCTAPIPRQQGESIEELIDPIQNCIQKQLEKSRGQGTRTASADG